MPCKSFNFVRPSKEVCGDKYTHEHVKYLGHYAKIVDVLDCEKQKIGFLTNDGLKACCTKELQTGWLPLKPKVDFICDRYTPDLSDYNNAVEVIYKPVTTYGISFEEAFQYAQQGFAITNKKWYKSFLVYDGEHLKFQTGKPFYASYEDLKNKTDWCLCDTKYFLDYFPNDVHNDQLEAMFKTNHAINVSTRDEWDYRILRGLVRRKPLHEYFQKGIPQAVNYQMGCISEASRIYTMLQIQNFMLEVYSVPVNNLCEKDFAFEEDYIDLSLKYWTTSLTKEYIPKRFPNIGDTHIPSFNYYNDFTCITNDISGERREPEERVEIKSPRIFPIREIVYGYLCGAYAENPIYWEQDKELDLDKSKTRELIERNFQTARSNHITLPEEFWDEYCFNTDNATNYHTNVAISMLVPYKPSYQNISADKGLEQQYPKTCEAFLQLTRLQETQTLFEGTNKFPHAAEEILALLLKEFPLELDVFGIRYMVVSEMLEHTVNPLQPNNSYETVMCKAVILLLMNHSEILSDLDGAMEDTLKNIYFASKKIDTIYPEEILDSYADCYIEPKIDEKLPLLIQERDIWDRLPSDTKITHLRRAVTMFEMGADPEPGYHRYIVDEIRILLEKVFDIRLPNQDKLDNFLSLQSQALLRFLFKGRLSSIYMREILEDNFCKHVLNRISEKLVGKSITRWTEAAHNLFGYKDIESLLVGEFVDVVYCVFVGKKMPFNYDKLSERFEKWVEKYPKNFKEEYDHINQFTEDLYQLIYKRLPLYVSPTEPEPPVIEPELPEEPDEEEEDNCEFDHDHEDDEFDEDTDFIPDYLLTGRYDDDLPENLPAMDTKEDLDKMDYEEFVNANKNNAVDKEDSLSGNEESSDTNNNSEN